MKTSAPTIKDAKPRNSASGRDRKSTFAPTNPSAKPTSATSGRNGATPAKEPPKSKGRTRGLRSLAELVAKYDTDPTLSHGDVARLIVGELSSREDGWDVALTAISAFVNTHRRPAVHRQERAIYRMFEPEHGMKRAASAVRKLTLEQLAAFANAPINMRRGTPVRAGEITLSEWEIKIAELEDGIAERQATVGFYRSVVFSLRNLKVDSIDTALEGTENGRR